MIDVQEAVMEAVPVEKGAAVEVRELRKEFRRKRLRKRGAASASAHASPSTASRSRWRGARPSRSSARTARGSRRSSACSRRSSCPDGGSARVLGHDVVAEHACRAPAREPRLGGGVVLQEDVRGREPRLRGALLRHDLEGDAREDPGDPRAGRLPARPTRRADGERFRGGCSRRSRSRAPSSPRRSCSCSTSRRRASIPARSSRCRSSSARSASSHDSTILLCTHDLAEAEVPRRARRHPRPRQAARARAGGRSQASLRGGDARGGVLRRDGPGVRGGSGRGRRRREVIA